MSDQPPRRPGRPEVGGLVQVRVGHDRLQRVDAAAALAGVTRAEIVRRCIDAALHHSDD